MPAKSVDGSRAVDGMGAPVLANRVGTALQPSGLSPIRGVDEEEEEDSLEGQGLTVEAYMAKRRQPKVRFLLV